MDVANQPQSSVGNADKFSLVAIGASAGGLKALKIFFSHIPQGCRHSFVIIQHLSQDFKSQVGDLLASISSLRIEVVQDGSPVEPGTIYLLPPSHNLEYRDGAFMLQPRPSRKTLNLPIDLFFTSLARELGNQSIGIILTGSGSDGTRGIRALKEAGGLVLVQDPREAQFDAMPQNAIHTGLVDFILPVEGLSQELIHYLNQANVDKGLEHKLEQDEVQIYKILQLARNASNIDFHQYKRTTLIRRIIRRMAITRCQDFDAYTQFLHTHIYEASVLANEFLLGVTSFFRDQAAWLALEKEGLPELIRSKTEREPVFKAWVAGCSTGEEAYTLAILVQEELRRQKKEMEVVIFATDIQKNALEIASQGRYPESILADIPLSHLSRYFLRKSDQYEVDPNLRKSIIFSQHDILKDPPFAQLDMALCRNMLIYFQAPAQQQALNSLHFALNLDGLLMLGKSEDIGNNHKGLIPLNRKQKIFINKKTGSFPNLSPGKPDQTTGILKSFSRKRAKELEQGMIHVFKEGMEESWGVVTIYLDENFDILFANGPIKDYLAFPEKGFSANFLRLLPSSLSLMLRDSLRKAADTLETVQYKHFKLLREEEVQLLNISVHPIRIAQTQVIDYYLVLFVPLDQALLSPLDLDLPKESSQHIEALERELKQTQQSLQSTIEELETTNEELQATNEELIAANEEMQSTNEELQSVNEELHSVNAEYLDKLEESIRLQLEIENLMKSTEIGTVFLDLDMRIRKFTPSIRRYFHLEDQDIGRPLAHFNLDFEGSNSKEILEDARLVLTSSQPSEEEMRSKDGLWFLRRIFPFLGERNEVEGVVITFIEITELKNTQEELQQREEFIQKVASTNPSLIYVYELTSEKIIFSNEKTQSILGYSSHDIIKMEEDLMEEITHPDDLDRVLTFQRELNSLEDGEVRTIESRVKHKEGHYIWTQRNNTVFLRADDGRVKQTIGTLIDIHQRKEAELALAHSQNLLQKIMDASPNLVYVYDLVKKKNVFSNRGVEKISGYSSQEILAMGTQVLAKITHPEDLALLQRYFKGLESLKDGEVRTIEARTQHKDGSFRWIQRNNSVFLRSEEGNVIQVIGTVIDIDKRKRAEEEVKEVKETQGQIIQTAPGMVYIYNLEEQQNEFASKSIGEMLGYSPKEIRDMGAEFMAKIFHPEDLEKIVAHHQHLGSLQVDKEMDPVALDYRCLHQDGTWRWLHSQDLPYSQNAAGKVNKIIGSAIDITERVNLQEQLKELLQ